MSESYHAVKAISVSAQPRRVPMSREQFLQLPEGPPFYDYVNGEAIEVSRLSVRHQEILLHLASQLMAYVEPRRLGLVVGGCYLELPNGNIYTPQTAVQIDTQRDYVRGVPDLVVAILSPSTAEHDRTQKMSDYAACAVLWVWLIDQETLLVEEYQWTPDGYLRRQAVDARMPSRPHLFPDLALVMEQLASSGIS